MLGTHADGWLSFPLALGVSRTCDLVVHVLNSDILDLEVDFDSDISELNPFPSPLLINMNEQHQLGLVLEQSIHDDDARYTLVAEEQQELELARERSV